MGRDLGIAAAMVGLIGAAGFARADLLYTGQNRFITASTSYDQNVQTVAAPDLGAFVSSIDLSTTFPTPTGGTGVNAASIGIDCQLDPNAIRVSGSLLGAGGLAVTGAGSSLQMAEARVSLAIDFHLDTESPFSLFSSPRVSTRPGDRFKIKLRDRGTHTDLFFLDESSPPQLVDLQGLMGAGDFTLEYECEMTIDGPETLAGYQFNLTVPAPGVLSVLGAAGLVAARRRRA